MPPSRYLDSARKLLGGDVLTEEDGDASPELDALFLDILPDELLACVLVCHTNINPNG